MKNDRYYAKGTLLYYSPGGGKYAGRPPMKVEVMQSHPSVERGRAAVRVVGTGEIIQTFNRRLSLTDPTIKTILRKKVVTPICLPMGRVGL